MVPTTRILIATTNPGKRDDFRALLADCAADLPIEWLLPADVGLAAMDVEETGDTFVANALLKARAYAQASGLAVLADDSGVAVDALNGAPGIYSARYAPTVTERNAKLLTVLADVPLEQRGARFICAIAIMFPGGPTLLGEGEVVGRITFAPRGTFGHGYDPVFELPDGLTFAERPTGEKNLISHRGRAFAALLPALRCLVN
ncbi:MAG: RdgB/HAM1 family non-canonical purine NTP pyrophosphatase [Aggregatilineales bacterium]